MKIKIIFKNNETNEILREEILDDVEVKASLTNILDISEWIINAVKNKARIVIDSICDKLSDKKVDKMSKTEKYDLIRNANLETAEERNARLIEELGGE